MRSSITVHLLFLFFDSVVLHLLFADRKIPQQIILLTLILLCDELITRPEESYRLRSVVECDLETSRMRRPWPTGDCCAK